MASIAGECNPTTFLLPFLEGVGAYLQQHKHPLLLLCDDPPNELMPLSLLHPFAWRHAGATGQEKENPDPWLHLLLELGLELEVGRSQS